MKLLLDQGLPRSSAPLLREEGIDTIHVSEIEMSAAEDIEIINKARADDRVVVTLDADFHALLALNKATTPSVIRIRIEGLQANAFIELLLRVISECIDELQQGVAVTVEPSRIRIRRLPLTNESISPR
jgi:predicted nuclease of predicted toxin-antitoxin system